MAQVSDSLSKKGSIMINSEGKIEIDHLKY